MTWIAERLRAHGTINRADVQREFDISYPQVAKDFAAFRRLHPGAMKYDEHRKCYVANVAKLPPAAPQDAARVELDAAHAELNRIGVPNITAGGPDARLLTLAERLAHVVSLEHHNASLGHKSVEDAERAT